MSPAIKNATSAGANPSTFLRSRTFKYSLIFLAWAAVVGFIDLVDQVPFEWRPAVWPYTASLSFLKLPGIVLIVATGAIHGFGSYWIDDSIVVLGSALFWFLVTITLMAIWSAIRRGLRSERRMG
jgi:hypothetical protein